MINITECGICEDGYYKNSDNICTLCSANCKCTESNSLCTGCLSGFFYENN